MKPEDVQLDVEGLARAAHENYRLKHPEMRIMPWADISEGARQINRERVELVLALLRRVSGKGAQKVSHPSWCPCGNMEHMVPVGTSYESAPVPAMPEPDSADWWRSIAQGLGVKLYAAEEVIEAWRLFTIGQSSKVRPERMAKEYLATPATTQGTPEGAK